MLEQESNKLIYRSRGLQVYINTHTDILTFSNTAGVKLTLPISTYDLLYRVIIDTVQASHRKKR